MHISDQIAALNPQPDERFSVNMIDQGRKMASVVLPPDLIPDYVHALPVTADIWIGMNPVGPHVLSGRGTNADVTRLTSLYCDLDEKPGGCGPGVAEQIIEDLCGLLGEDFTYMTFTGHGIHPVWAVEDGDSRSNADLAALLKRWGRLVKQVAKDRGAQADSVFDLSRILRAIGTRNNKDEIPIEVVGVPGRGGPLTLDQIDDRLNELGIYEVAEIAEVDGDTEVPTKGWAKTECWYAAQTFTAWQSEIPRQGRHPWLVSQFTRLEAMKILGCLTYSQYQSGAAILANRFTALCAGGVSGDKRPVGQYEIADCRDWGQRQATSKTMAGLLSEVGGHRHDMFGDIVKERAPQSHSGGNTDPLEVGQPGPETSEVEPDDREPTPEELQQAIFQAEENFWDSRDSLKQIFEAAMANMVSPWAVFSYSAARILQLVPSTVELPGLVGPRGSLNWFAIVVDKSGGGKSAAASVAELIVAVPFPQEIYEVGVGSGEGMINQFFMKDPNDPKGKKVRREAVMFTADEIDNLTAMSQRQGGTTLPMIRTAFSGGTLGHSYVAQGRDIHVKAHTYRMSLVVNAQPSRCSTLLGDAGGGTPQRFMWFPANDKRISVEASDENHYTPSVSIPPLALLGRKRIEVPDEARLETKTIRVAQGHGDSDGMKGHANFSRLKLAYALALLDGRTDMDSEDWRLSGIAAEVSSRTLAWVQAELADSQVDEVRQQGRLRGVGFAAAKESESSENMKRSRRIQDGVLKKLKTKGPLTSGALRRMAYIDDRPWVDGAIDVLAADGLIALADDGKHWATA